MCLNSIDKDILFTHLRTDYPIYALKKMPYYKSMDRIDSFFVSLFNFFFHFFGNNFDKAMKKAMMIRIFMSNSIMKKSNTKNSPFLWITIIPYVLQNPYEEPRMTFFHGFGNTLTNQMAIWMSSISFQDMHCVLYAHII